MSQVVSISEISSVSEVSEHKYPKDGAWFVINGEVYDVSNLLDEHSGDGELLVEVSIDDVTKALKDVSHLKKVNEHSTTYVENHSMLQLSSDAQTHSIITTVKCKLL
jgi:cytochrome b involved in lipid metabolism